MRAEQEAMKRLIHAMAAIGAALVFGCAGAPDEDSQSQDRVYCEGEESPRGCDPSRMNADMSEPNEEGITAPFDGYYTAEQMLDPSEPEPASLGGELGQTQQAFRKAFNTGVSVPNGTTFLNYNSFFAEPCNTTGSHTCIWPSNAAPFGKTWTWRFDYSNCPGTFGSDMMRLGAQQAFNRAQLGSGWQFIELDPQNGFGENITVYCMYPDEVANSASGVLAFGYPYGTASTIPGTNTAATFDKCQGTGPAFEFGFHAAATYVAAGISLNYDRLYALFKSCHGGTSAGNETFLEASMYNTVLHELGHALGFDHNLAFPMQPIAACSLVDGTLQTAPPSSYRAFPVQLRNALSDLNRGGSNLTIDEDVSCLGPFTGVDSFYGSSQ
jgi:hypothetical protein